MKKIFIIGAGGFGREVAWLIERINQVKPEWQLQGFIDDNAEIHGTSEDSYPVIGGCEYLKQCEEEIWAVCAIGAAEVRERVIQKVKEYRNVRFATLIDPSVSMSSRVEIGEGSILCSGTVCTVDIHIGCHVIINLNCTVGHDAIIEDFVTIYPSVNVSGCAVIEKGVELGTGTQIIQGKRVSSYTIVGAGAVVIKDLPEKCTAVGIPARPVKYRNESE